jgi:hypothetical protein
MPEPVEDAVQTILENIDCQTRKIGGIEDYSAGWIGIREAWRDLALALLTAARQRFDRDTFDRRLAALAPFLSDHPDVAQRIHHEKCLWALYELDFNALDGLLKEWRPEGCDPIWMTRKAAILVEMSRNDEAVRLLNRSLSVVREMPHGRHNLASASREGWTLWLALAFERDFWQSMDEEVIDSPSAFGRWKQLAALECDAFAQKRNILDDLQGKPEKKDGPLFDLGARRGETIRFSNAEYKRWITAQRVVRLSEIAGLPPWVSRSAFNQMVASDILSLAVDQVISTDYALALRLVLRLVKDEDDAIFNRVWSRTRIAAMSMGEVTALVELVSNIISYSLPRATNFRNDSVFWVTRLRVAMEALSRLVLRMPPERAKIIFEQGLAYYMKVKPMWLAKPIEHLLSRAWEALPNSYRTGFVLDILSAPIAGVDGFEVFQLYPDPGKLLIEDDEIVAPARLPETEGQWSTIIHLIIRGLRCSDEARKRAASRLVRLARWNCLTDSEKQSVAQALWHPDYIDKDMLPGGTSLYDWVFLYLPEPEPSLAEQRFRKKWLGSQELKSERAINEYFWRIGNALASFKHRQRPLTLTEDEYVSLTALIQQWIGFPITSSDSSFVEFGTREGIIGLQFLLPEIDLPLSTADSLFKKVVELNQSVTPAFRLLGALAKSLSDRLDQLATSMRVGLASDNAAIAEEAVLGLHGWLRDASEEASKVPAPPPDLVREVGVIIACRRKSVLNRALQLARWIFTNGTSEQRDTIAQMTLHGLSYLIEELRYDRDHGDDGEVEIPLLRWGCAHLALAMLACGYETDSTVTRWADIAKNDPLPEVRHAEVPTLIRT